MCFRDSGYQTTAAEAALAPRPIESTKGTPEAAQQAPKQSNSVFSLKARRRAEAASALEAYKQQNPDFQRRLNDLDGCEHRMASPWAGGELYAASEVIPKSSRHPEIERSI